MSGEDRVEAEEYCSQLEQCHLEPGVLDLVLEYDLE